MRHSAIRDIGISFSLGLLATLDVNRSTYRNPIARGLEKKVPLIVSIRAGFVKEDFGLGCHS